MIEVADGDLASVVCDSFSPLKLGIRFDVGPHAGERIDVTLNADGSVTVSDWDLIGWYLASGLMSTRSQDFPVLTLLMAARGKIKEVTEAEAHEIARRYGADPWLSAPVGGSCS